MRSTAKNHFMETNMSNILLLIVAISWFANDIECLGSKKLEPEPVNHIFSDKYELIQRKLTILGVYDEKESTNHFNQKRIKKVKNIWRTPEICEWKDVIDKIEPENNLCLIVAVYLSTQMPAETEPVTPARNYTPYECFKMAVNNVKSKLVMKPRKKVIYCPKTVIILSQNTNTSYTSTMQQHPIKINSFLIGRGDYRRNSIRVYRFIKGGKAMDLIYYLYNVLTYSELETEKEEYSNLRHIQLQKGYKIEGARTADERFLKHLKDKKVVRNPSNKRSCEKSVKENMETCKDLSAFRIANSDAKVKNGLLVTPAPNVFHQQTVNNGLTQAGNQMPSNVTLRSKIDSIDKSGFLAYVCINRPVKVLTSVYKRDLIFCPQQIIVGIKNKQTFRQPGFFYSTDFYEDSYFIYDVTFKQIDVTTFNGRAGTGKVDATINYTAIEKMPDSETVFEIFDSITLSNYVTWNAQVTLHDKKILKQIKKELKDSDES